MSGTVRDPKGDEERSRLAVVQEAAVKVAIEAATTNPGLVFVVIAMDVDPLGRSAHATAMGHPPGYFVDAKAVLEAALAMEGKNILRTKADTETVPS